MTTTTTEENKNWVVVLFGGRTLLGVPDRPKEALSGLFLHLEPVYQLEVRAVPIQGVDPQTKQPVMGMSRQRFIMSVGELEIASVEVPIQTSIIKPISEMSANAQKELTTLVINYEEAMKKNRRQAQINAQLAESQSQSFGGGARPTDDGTNPQHAFGHGRGDS
jgi:hypothetical protein